MLVHNRTQRVPGLRYRRLEEVLAWAHVIVVCVAHTPDTVALINHTNAVYVRHGAIVISVSREGVVDSEALSDCVAQGRVTRFIFEADMPTPIDSRSADLPRGISKTPHVAWYTAEAEQRLRDEVLQNVTNIADLITDSQGQAAAHHGGGP